MSIGIRIGPRVGCRVAPRMGADSSSTTTTLTVAIADSIDPVITLGAYSYTVVVENTGSNTATTVVCDVQLDASSAFVSGSGSGWTVADQGSNLIRCTRATLSVGVAPTITIDVTAPAAAETSSATADVDAANSSPATQDTETTVVNLVDRDATSGIRVPSTSTQWTNFIAFHGLAAPVPNSLWLFQEASGNVLDKIASLDLVANSTPTYQQAVAGWTRLGVQMDDASSDRVVMAAATGPDPTTTSQMWTYIHLMPVAPSALRSFQGINVATSTNSQRVLHNTDGKLRMVSTGNTVNGSVDHSSQVCIVSDKYDRTNSAAMTYSNLEKMTGTYASGVIDGNKGVGAANSAMSGVTPIYGFMHSGANAEAMTDAVTKALYQALGFTISWS